MRCFRFIPMGFLTVSLLVNTACNTTVQDARQRTSSNNIPNEQHILLSQPNAQIIANVDLKHNPSVKSGTIRHLKAGEKVRIIDQKDPHWLKIADETNTVGYIRSEPQFIKIILR